MASINQLPSGRWRAQVRAGGAYKSKTFTLKRDADAWSRQVEAMAESSKATGYATAPKGTTMADLIDAYIEAIAHNPGGRTKQFCLQLLRRELGRVPLDQLSRDTLADFIMRRKKQGAGGTTISADLSFLSSVLKWAREFRRLEVDARLAMDARASLKHLKMRTRSRVRDREPTDDELQRIFEHWASKPRQKVPAREICQLALTTTMRLSEVCNLMVEDVDREARTVIVRQRKDPDEKRDGVVPLLADAWAIVEPQIENRAEGRIFEANARSVSTAFTRACKALGIDGLRFHDTRHRATSDLFRRDLGIPEVAVFTGHQSWTNLRRYTKVTPSDIHAKLARLEARNEPPPQPTPSAPAAVSSKTVKAARGANVIALPAARNRV